jgi:hypothetical protein
MTSVFILRIQIADKVLKQDSGLEKWGLFV